MITDKKSKLRGSRGLCISSKEDVLVDDVGLAGFMAAEGGEGGRVPGVGTANETIVRGAFSVAAAMTEVDGIAIGRAGRAGVVIGLTDGDALGTAGNFAFFFFGVGAIARGASTESDIL